MGDFKDLTGQYFGKWEALSYEGEGNWKCKCHCEYCGGAIRHVHRYSLLSGKSTSCGKSKVSIEVGDIFGEWEVIDATPVKYKIKCKCSCGKIKDINMYTLKSGRSTGCGHTKNKDRVIDLTGQIFGELEVLRYLGEQKWECRCSCDRITIKYRNHLLDGRATTCGFHGGKKELEDLAGQRFGKLVAKKYLGRKRWLCDCDCGNSRIAVTRRLKNGGIKSCGCILYTPSSEELQELIKEYTNTHDRKPSILDLARIEDVSYKIMQYHLSKYELNNSDVLDVKFASQGERELYQFIRENISKDTQVLHNVRNIIKPWELDIYIPELKLAIEYNGTYWHSTLNKSISYHRDKTIACNAQGIHLIHIFEYEWINEGTQKKIKELLLSKINNQYGIAKHSKDLVIKEINCDEAFHFLNENHLQDGIYSQVNIGIYEDSKLLGVLSTNKSKSNSGYQWELTRIVFKSGYKIIGGLERLFKYFLNMYKPKSIIYYCNAEKYLGDSYDTIGFKCIGHTEPNYVWVNNDSTDIISRYQSSKSKLIANGIKVSNDDTEDTIMSRLGYYKIYDSGNLVFAWSHD